MDGANIQELKKQIFTMSYSWFTKIEYDHRGRDVIYSEDQKTAQVMLRTALKGTILGWVEVPAKTIKKGNV